MHSLDLLGIIYVLPMLITQSWVGVALFYGSLILNLVLLFLFRLKKRK